MSRPKIFAMRYKALQGKRSKRLHRLKNHPFVVPVATFLTLFFITALFFIFSGGKTLQPDDAHVVIVSYDKKRQTVPTRVATVGELLAKLGITLREGDIVEPAKDTPIVEDNFRVNVYRGRPVTLIDGGRKTLTYSAGSTSRAVAAQAGVTVYPEDNLTRRPTEDVLKNGISEEIIIDRATPVLLNLYGTALPVRTHSKTVKDLLNEKKVKLAEGETVQPELNTALQPNQAIFVNKKDIRVETTAEDIAPPTQVIEDNTLSFGTTAVRQQGTPGKRITVFQVNTATGAKNKLQEVLVQEPVPTIVARGKAISIPEDKSSLMAAAGISSGDYAYVNFIIARESGWCPTKLQGQIGYCPAYAPAYIPSGIGYGLGQATPGGKMSPYGADWQSNPVTQLKWATAYAKSRHGGWAGAYNYWLSHHNW